jgi:hypothetical protein
MDFLDSIPKDLQKENKKKTTICTVCGELTTHIEMSRNDVIRILDATTGKTPSGLKINGWTYAIATMYDLNFIWNAFSGKLFVCSLCKHPSVQGGMRRSRPEYKGFQVHVVNKHKSDISICIHYHSEGNWHTSRVNYIESNHGGILIPSEHKVTGRNIYVHAYDNNGKLFQGRDTIENNKGDNRYYETIDGEEKEFSLVRMPGKFCSFAIKFTNNSFK